MLPVNGLDPHYYKKSYPHMEAIIQRKVKELIKQDYSFGASLLRLHYHDAAVRGYDGSILIDIPEKSEKYTDGSKTLRGFEFIEEVKAALELECPQTVSCADILTTVGRDATNMEHTRLTGAVADHSARDSTTIKGPMEQTPSSTANSLITWREHEQVTRSTLILMPPHGMSSTTPSTRIFKMTWAYLRLTKRCGSTQEQTPLSKSWQINNTYSTCNFALL